MQKENITLICFSASGRGEAVKDWGAAGNVRFSKNSMDQDEYIRLIESAASDAVVLADADRLSAGMIKSLLQTAGWPDRKKQVGYVSGGRERLGMIRRLWGTDGRITRAPLLFGPKAVFLQAYGGDRLLGDVMGGVAYSLQKSGRVNFRKLAGVELKKGEGRRGKAWPWMNYSFGIPFRCLVSGVFSRPSFSFAAKVQRDMVFRMLMLLFVCFSFLYMPAISRDYGISGDEIVDNNQVRLVLDYFEKGDRAAVHQPKSMLHFYGISLQVVCGAIARYVGVDDVYVLRHAVCALTGAAGILFAGLLGWRWGGGLCGLLSVLLMFFTPRYFGHSMNNLKDLPFAVGYMASIYYMVRLFDTFPHFRLNYMLGLVFGLALALGTRSGGLVLYPMLLMYGGLVYVLYYGRKNCWKLLEYRRPIVSTLAVVLLVGVAAYGLSILLWPYALEHPFTGMFLSLKQFTHYSIGLRTIFEGEQMMSNMLPWHYAPQYFWIGVPVVTVVGFWGYLLYCLVRRKEFSLISYLMLFAALFPVFWVVYKNSNLYGGIRQLLFVMPVMVVVAARFWTLLLEGRSKGVRLAAAPVFLVGLGLPAAHMIRNHPNDYVYFNEFAGGMQKAYGNYETDYYYNSLKKTADWFKRHVDHKDKQVLIATNHAGILEHYFRKDKQVKVVYTRYYEKYAKDWDYGIFANVYINAFQLKRGWFPPDSVLYTSDVDGYPMSALIARGSKDELEGFRLEKEKKYAAALAVFQEAVKRRPQCEEIWSRMAKLAYLSDRAELGEEYALKSLQYHPELNEGLYVLALCDIRLGKYPEAIQAAQRMLRQNISSVDAYYLQALALKHLGRYKEAIDQLNRVLAYRPKHERALLLAGDILLLVGDSQSARQVYERVFKESGSLEALVAMADCAVRTGDYKSALQMLGDAEKAQPGYWPAGKVRLRMALQRQDLPEAGKILASLPEVPDDAGLFVLKAMYAEKIRDKEGMKAALQRALAIEPKNLEAWKLQQK